MKKHHKKVIVVILYTLAMAWVEAAVVCYLRTLVHRIVPYQADPLPLQGGLGGIELAREFATLVMLGAVGWLAGVTFRSRFGFFLIGFGVWDLFYYVFLKMMCGWPSSIWDWDILFLIPLPWWGPVAAPCLIALLMIAFGLRMTRPRSRPSDPGIPVWSCCAALAGMTAALFLFMKDAIAAVANGYDADVIRQLLPDHFSWLPFLTALAMMSTPLWEPTWRSFSPAFRGAKNPGFVEADDTLSDSRMGETRSR
jgi:hypothetical protein